MSLDYPEYEKMKKENLAAAILWQIGDIFYYLFLVGGIVATMLIPYKIGKVGDGRDWWLTLKCAGIVLLGSIVGCIISGYMKSLSYKILERFKH